jgi:hypothetical protein
VNVLKKSAVLISINWSMTRPRYRIEAGASHRGPGVGMVAQSFEVYAAFCFFSLIAFLVLAAVAKLRPDLDGGRA